MMNAVYPTDLRKDRQKALGYAIPFVSAIGGKVSVIVVPHHPNQWVTLKTGGMRAAPDRCAETNGRNRGPENPLSERLSLQKVDLLVMGKPRSFSKTDPYRSAHMIELMEWADFPLLVVPYDFRFERIRRILFAGNEPGLADHFLLHRLAAAFLPRAFSLERSGIRPIHWNNVCKLPGLALADQLLLSPRMDKWSKRLHVDLIVFPTSNEWVATADGALGSVLREAQVPVLLFPPKSLIDSPDHSVEASRASASNLSLSVPREELFMTTE